MSDWRDEDAEYDLEKEADWRDDVDLRDEDDDLDARFEQEREREAFEEVDDV